MKKKKKARPGIGIGVNLTLPQNCLHKTGGVIQGMCENQQAGIERSVFPRSPVLSFFSFMKDSKRLTERTRTAVIKRTAMLFIFS